MDTGKKLTKTHIHEGVRILEDRLDYQSKRDFTIWSIPRDRTNIDNLPHTFTTLAAAKIFINSRLDKSDA